MSPSSRHLRRLGVGGLAGLALLAAAYWATLEPAPRIRVLWREGIAAGQQSALEARYLLRNGRDRLPEGSVAYDLLDTSRANIERLVEDPAVADTNDIDRNAYVVEPETDRGDEWTWVAYRVPVLRAAWPRLALILIFAIAAAAGLGRDSLRLGRRVIGAARQVVQAWNTHWRLHGGTRAAVEAIPSLGWRGTSALVFGGCVAAAIVLVGTRDLEGFETSFFSLDREAAVAVVRVLGQPVYTMAVGLGVRLPLHGSLGASPAAALAPYLPGPWIYWLLIAFSIAGSALVVRHALEPIAGRAVSWLAIVLVFSSVPLVNYSIYDDWPETAVTYCAFVACVFAPHALLTALATRDSPAVRRIAVLAIAATVWSLIALSHPGYWPQLAGTLVLGAALALSRPGHPFSRGSLAIVALGVVSLLPVALQAPDLLREVMAASAPDAAPMLRQVEGPVGSLLPANAFPFVAAAPRMPFTYVPLVVVSLLIGLLSNDPQLRRLAVGGALVSIALGVAAATLPAGGAWYAPSTTWALRDPAIGFAVLSGAAAVASIYTSPRVAALLGARLAAGALLVAALQGVAYAGQLVMVELVWRGHREPWMQNTSPGEDRARTRGLPPERFPPGERLALWPGVRTKMRLQQRASTDFADAGYLLVTALTKNRTMRGLVPSQEALFNQTTDLSAQILCDGTAVRFLQLRYIVAPPGVECGPWKRVPDVHVDGWLEVGIASDVDDRAWALPASGLAEPTARQPAFSDSSVLSSLVPLPGTSVTLTPPGVAIQLDDPSRAGGHALVLPLAYDPALRASSGQVRNVGGLAAVTGIDRSTVTVEFVPDLPALLRASSMTLAQVLAVVGFVGMACVAWRCG